ncbi:MAG: CBS domain-containing protein [Candidatus Omnitrophica bacterium]|nr:CBS domain-containing protein [Candidatus Omnitrophota bacterium]
MLKARDIMRKNFETVSENTDVKRICNILIKNRVSGLPVVNEKKKIRGFVSERDIINSIGKYGSPKKKARDIMTKHVVLVKEGESVERVSKIFTNKPFRYIPVVRKGFVVGIISRKEVIGRLLGQYY